MVLVPAVFAATADAEPRAAVDPAPDGFLLVPFVGVSAAHFSQPPDDEGPQWLVGPTVGVFIGERLHGVTFGIALDHTQAVLDAEEGYDTRRADHRIERVTARIGHAFRMDHCAITPSLSVGLLDTDVPFYGGELVGVSGSAGLAFDWAISPALAVGGDLAIDLGTAESSDRTVTSYGATLGAHLSFRP
jgi:hypothetical protein